MNFIQLQERLRAEIQRRIDRGVLSGIMLAHQTGLSQAHISNFLRRKRLLSVAAIDRVLASQVLTLSDLAPRHGVNPHHLLSPNEEGFDDVPLVSAMTALRDPFIPDHAIIHLVRIPPGLLQGLHPRRAKQRREWQRFVAIRLSASQAEPMHPLLAANSILVLDRHYNSLIPYRAAQPNIYALRVADALVLRYVSFEANRLVLRPAAPQHPIELLSLGPGESPSDLLIARACVAISEI